MISNLVYSDDEFEIHYREFKQGEFNRGFRPRNGFILPVPIDSVEKEKFFIKYPPVCESVTKETNVLIHYQAQMLQYGRFIFTDEQGWDSEEIANGIYALGATSFHEYYSKHKITSMKFLENSQFTCIIPLAKQFFWDRKFRIVLPSTSITIPRRLNTVQRLVIVSGSLYCNDIEYHGPTVVNITEDFTANTIYQEAQLVEFWKEA